MKTMTLIGLLCAAVVSACAPSPAWVKFNPLDEPGEERATAAELHAKNRADITGNPSTMYLP